MQDSELIDRLRSVIRQKKYSRRTEAAYVRWARQFLNYYELRDPATINDSDVSQFLSYLAGDRCVSISTRNQALTAIQFFYREILNTTFQGVKHSKRPDTVPLVFTKEEVRAVLDRLKGTNRLMAALLYGSGLRLGECLLLRVRDIDFDKGQIIVRTENGQKDRATFLPESLAEGITQHLNKVKMIHEKDIKERFGQVTLPFASDQKNQEAGRRWQWQYVFPSNKRMIDPRSGIVARQPLSEGAIQRPVRDAIRAAGIRKQASCHTFRHSFAVHLLESGCDIHVVQQLIGHKDINTTMVYTQLVPQKKIQMKSPLDTL